MPVLAIIVRAPLTLAFLDEMSPGFQACGLLNYSESRNFKNPYHRDLLDMECSLELVHILATKSVEL
jgi:hypothetical protein